MAVESAAGTASLVEVLERVLDKGIVIDAWRRLSLVGIELPAGDVRVVVASVETYLKYAEAAQIMPVSRRPQDTPDANGGHGSSGAAAMLDTRTKPRAHGAAPVSNSS